MSGDSLDEEWKKLKKKGINQKGSTKDVSFKADSKKKVNVFDEDITLLLHKFHSEWREDLQKEQAAWLSYDMTHENGVGRIILAIRQIQSYKSRHVSTKCMSVNSGVAMSWSSRNDNTWVAMSWSLILTQK
ncbi:hypothetical protein ACET3Z_025917 [Daucus carota]